MMRFWVEPNEDELLYSQLARVYVRTGYMFYRAIAEELYEDRQTKPSVEYLNRFTEDTYKNITRNMPFEEVIMKHTMYPYYARFYPKDIKEKAYSDLLEMKGKIGNLLTGSMKKYGEDRCLRFCPLCAEEDVEKYHEKFWHRTHQLIGVKVCPKHGCYLQESKVCISGNKKLSIVSAEEEITISEVNYPTSELEKELSQYIAKVFHSEFELQTDSDIGRFLHSKLVGTKYVSTRGQQKNIKLLVKDLNEFYKELNEISFKEEWQVQKIFNGKKWDTYHICLLGFFLKISVEELLEMKVEDKRPEEIFDEKVRRLKNEGKTYAEIARVLETDATIVQAICTNMYLVKKSKSENAKKTGRERWDWNKIDEENLPLVKEIIRKLQGDYYGKPRKISFHAIEKELNMPDGRIKGKLPKCKAEIIKCQETLEAYWAREVLWAMRKTEQSGRKVNWKRIRELTNIRNVDLVACLPYLKKIAKKDEIEIVTKIINELAINRRGD